MAETIVKTIDGKILVHKTHAKAEYPHKTRASDIGWDITLIGRVDNRAEDDISEVNMFNTGLQIAPPDGYYLEMVARSSLHKNGYTLVTGTSIIDPEYRGELIVPLFKFKDVDDLELPFTAVQLILRKAIYAHVSHSAGLDLTSRGDKGFGSTGYAPQNGAYIQQPMNQTYSADMDHYKQTTSTYGKGVRRPAAAPPRKNYMF